MSLYNNVEKFVLQTASSGRKSSPNGIIDNAVGSLGMGSFGSATAVIAGNMAANAGMAAAQKLVNKYIPADVQKGLKIAGGMASDFMKDGEDGGLNGVGLGLLDSGLLNDMLPGMSGVASQIKYWKTPTPLFGGITPTEAAKIYDDMRGNSFSKKNLFLIEISSKLMGAGISQRFNMFVTEIDYAPFTISGEKRKVGSASVDSVQSSEPIEMRITTMDDQSGSIKRWYVNHHGAAAQENGTVGVPDNYAIQIKVVHSFITRKSIRGGYEDIGLFRPANLEFSLSRREDGLQEVQMTFSQLDTFMKV